MKLSLPILLTLLPLLSWAGTVQASSQPEKQPLETSPAPADIKPRKPPKRPTKELQEQATTQEVKAMDKTKSHIAPTHLTPTDPRYWAEYCPPCGRG